MATIPLYNADALPDAWHQVGAPGGYEHWRFEAIDAEHDRQIVAELCHGDAFDRKYRRRFLEFVRDPTRIGPPAPREFITAKLRVFHQGRLESAFAASFPPEQFSAQTDYPAVHIGSNYFGIENNLLKIRVGEVHLEFQSHGEDRIVRAVGGQRWIIANPSCDVHCESLGFSGRGFHDHVFSDRPISGRHFRGWIAAPNQCIAFLARQQEVHAIEFAPESANEIDGKRIDLEWPANPSSSVPNMLNIQAIARLHSPRIIERSENLARVIYESQYRGIAGVALCEMVHFADAG